MSAFPENIVDTLVAHLAPNGAGVPSLIGVDHVVARALNPTDPNGSVGIAVDEWLPVDYEMVGGIAEPSIAVHVLTIQHVVKHTNEAAGLRLHREVANSLRRMLYRDPELIVALRQLRQEDIDGRRERIQKWNVTAQRYASNEIGRELIYMSATELRVHTETI